MIVCQACGHANAEGARFCASCDTFLEWKGVPVQARRSEPLVNAGPSAPRTEPFNLASAPPPLGPPSFVDRSVVDRSVVDRSVEPLAPALAPQEEWQRIRPQHLSGVGEPADLYCGQCGRGNRTGRKYCRYCGADLADAAPVAVDRPGWWRRFVAWVKGLFTREETVLAAGERPSSWSGKRGSASTSAESNTSSLRRKATSGWSWTWPPRRLSIGKIMPGFMAFIVLGFVISPLRNEGLALVSSAVDTVRRTVAPASVPVSAVNAAAVAPEERPGIAAVDRNTETWWQAVPGQPAQLLVQFDGPADIDDVGFTNGAAGEEFTEQARAKDVRLDFSDGTSTRVTLEDVEDFQSFDIEATQVDRVLLTVESVYGGQEDAAVALAEVQFNRNI